MSDDLKDIISIFENLQNEYIALYEKNNLDTTEVSKFKEEQKVKLYNFRMKLIQYKLEVDKPCIKREHHKENSCWDSYFSK